MEISNNFFYPSPLLYNCQTFFQHFEKLVEGVQENEPNTFEIRVDSSMTRDEVVAQIIEKVTY